MTVVHTCVPGGSLPGEQASHVAQGSTDVCGEAQGIPKLRRAIWLHTNDIPDGGWSVGGEANVMGQMRAHYGLAP